MNLPHDRRYWLGILLVVAMTTVASAAVPERVRREVDGFTIEYAIGDEAYADALAAQLRGVKWSLSDDTAPKLTLTEIARRRDYFLGRATVLLALKEPSAKMTEVFDAFLKIMGMLGEARNEPPRRFALWRRPELLARLTAGEKIPGFELGGETGMRFVGGYNVNMKTADDGTVSVEKSEGFMWPLAIGKVPGKPAEEEVADALRDAQEGVREIMGAAAMWEALQVFLLLHETMESGIVFSYLSSADRRWFCDGMANYGAWKIIADEVGAEEAKKYYDLETQLKNHAAHAGADLERWPAAENMDKPNYGEDLNQANYAFATKVIADVAAKHGPDIFPKLFREIGRTKREKASIKTVYRAFKKLTGEDLRSYLPKPATRKR